ncbi:hypothetical protein Dsin_013153 [Dipteronia sinensis]|uniref:Cyclic nucleotide-binding domain-containing protein n=1 Tax=Dipteronia sinensis TaxID=43782 RepID=A0AAE0AJV8_9ROSI|nr:hypothetical protein Dsin_013153 [Dipteronia sinensis]
MQAESLDVNSKEIDTHIRDDQERRLVEYVKKFLDPRGPFPNWIPLILCVMSISMDPLFFYIPVIKMDKNCMDLDKNLGVVSCVFRTVIDLFYIIYIRYNISAPRPLLPVHYIDLLAVLPLPQVVIIIIVSKMSLSKFLEAMDVLKYFVFFQFVPRVIRIYPLFKKATSTRIMLVEVTWAKAAFNLYLYIMSGHVFGALWYFFAIEREIGCWKKACIVIKKTSCNHQSFNCHKSSGNYRFLNVCSTKTHNTAFYDFGIYLDALQSGVVEGSYLQKFMYCFRWGLQSLSCFAQNLVTSIDIWENIFTISITISSVLLFTFLIGNMQFDLQRETTRSEEIKLKMKEIEQCTTFKKLSENLHRQVHKYHQHLLGENKGVDVENLLNKLPRHLRRRIKSELCLDMLKKVPNFEFLSEQQLNAMCERLEPVLYPAETYILGKGDQIDEMLFIIRGKLLSTSSNGSDRNLIDVVYRTEFCGEELSIWARDPRSSSDQLPISSRTIKAHTEVEAFALMADDMKAVFINQFRRSGSRYHPLRWRGLAACITLAAATSRRDKHRCEDEERPLNELAAADGSSTSSVGATINAMPIADNALIRRRNSKKGTNHDSLETQGS